MLPLKFNIFIEWGETSSSEGIPQIFPQRIFLSLCIDLQAKLCLTQTRKKHLIFTDGLAKVLKISFIIDTSCCSQCLNKKLHIPIVLL